MSPSLRRLSEYRGHVLLAHAYVAKVKPVPRSNKKNPTGTSFSLPNVCQISRQTSTRCDCTVREKNRHREVLTHNLWQCSGVQCN